MRTLAQINDCMAEHSVDSIAQVHNHMSNWELINGKMPWCGINGLDCFSCYILSILLRENWQCFENEAAMWAQSHPQHAWSLLYSFLWGQSDQDCLMVLRSAAGTCKSAHRIGHTAAISNDLAGQVLLASTRAVFLNKTIALQHFDDETGEPKCATKMNSWPTHDLMIKHKLPAEHFRRSILVNIVPQPKHRINCLLILIPHLRSCIGLHSIRVSIDEDFVRPCFMPCWMRCYVFTRALTSTAILPIIAPYGWNRLDVMQNAPAFQVHVSS